MPHLFIFTFNLSHVSCISIRYFGSVSVGIFLVFYQPIPKENSVRIFSVLCLWWERTHQRSQLHPPQHTIDKNRVFSLRKMTTMIFLREAGHHAPPTWFPSRLPPKKIQHEPILLFALPLARPAPSCNRNTEKSCVRSQRWHTMIFLREAGHHAPPSQQDPPKKTQHIPIRQAK